MNATPKPPRDSAAEDPTKPAVLFEDFVSLYVKGVECLAEAQTRTLECAAQQNKEAVETWRRLADKLPWMPRLNLFDGFAGSVDRFAEAQKAALHLTVDQTRAFVDLVKDRTAAAGKTVDTLSRFAQQSFDRSVAAQKKAAEATVAETRSAFENVREHFPVAASEVVTETLRKSVQTAIDAQKDLLDTAARGRAPAPQTVGAA